MANIPHIEAKYLGGFSFKVDGEPQTQINQPQQQLLLAYLTLCAQTPQPRRRVAFTFWPDHSEPRAYANLRRALHKLRSDCPAIDHFLTSSSTALCWPRTPHFSLDVLHYEDLLAQANQVTDRPELRNVLMQAADLYRGELLPGHYDDWLLVERERLEQGCIQLLHRLVNLLVEEGAYESAIAYATRVRHTDPYREQTYWLEMTLYEKAGDRTAALRAYHDCVAMLERHLGVEPSSETQAIYRRILDESESHVLPRRVPTRPHRRAPKTEHLLVGRQAAWRQLQAAWQRAKSGAPQLVLIQGEAGIGKTHLAEALLMRSVRQDQLAVHVRAYAAEESLLYLPVIEWLRTPPYGDVLSSLDDVWLGECARLLPEILTIHPHLTVPPALSDSWQKQRLFEALARAVLAPGKPLLVLFDDLQWADKETLEWLAYLLRYDTSVPLLLLGTVRMSEVSAAHPLAKLLQQLHRDGRIEEIALGPLDAEASDELAQQIAGSRLTSATLSEVRHYAEGVPLFLVEVVRAEMEKEATQRWDWSVDTGLPGANAVPVPPRIYAVIQARLGQLSSGARHLADVAAVLGSSFSYALLALASRRDEDRLVQNLDELWQRRIIRESGTDYDFSHDRIRDVTYAEMSPIQRKRLHRHVAEALHQLHADNLDVVSPQLAHHCEAAGLFAQAVDYYLQAGERAQSVYANEQACVLLQRGIALLPHLAPSQARTRQELSLYTALSASLRLIHGWTSPDMYEAASRAWELTHQLDEAEQRFRLINFMSTYHIVRGTLDEAEPWIERALESAEHEQSTLFYMMAYTRRSFVSFYRWGEFRSSHVDCERCLTLYEPSKHLQYTATDGVNTGILAYVTDAHSLWMLGLPRQALERCRQGLDEANSFNHPFSQIYSLAYLTTLYYFLGDMDRMVEHARTGLALTTQVTMVYYQKWINIFFTWAQAMASPGDAGLKQLQDALAAFRTTNAGLRWPLYLSLLALYYKQTGQVDEALSTIDDALAAAARHGQIWWNGELLRLRGDLRLLRDGMRSHDAASADYQQAIQFAQKREALSLELRAATSLARLWQRQGQAEQAHAMLAPVYNRFSEGFETADLQEAHALLSELQV